MAPPRVVVLVGLALARVAAAPERERADGALTPPATDIGGLLQQFVHGGNTAKLFPHADLSNPEHVKAPEGMPPIGGVGAGAASVGAPAGIPAGPTGAAADAAAAQMPALAAAMFGGAAPGGLFGQQPGGGREAV